MNKSDVCRLEYVGPVGLVIRGLPALVPGTVYTVAAGDADGLRALGHFKAAKAITEEKAAAAVEEV